MYENVIRLCVVLNLKNTYKDYILTRTTLLIICNMFVLCCIFKINMTIPLEVQSSRSDKFSQKALDLLSVKAKIVLPLFFAW